MYHIKGESILTFLEDQTIRLPRFQRKQTWNNDQNFKLAISLFKDFPIGVTIINKQSLGGKSTRWLLDGRQRRNALEKIYQDPENIYLWARKYLGLKNSDQLTDVQEKFWSKIDTYINDIDETSFNEARNQAMNNGEKEFYYDGRMYLVSSSVDEEEDFLGEFTEDDLDIENTVKSNEELLLEYNQSVQGNLNELLFIIQTVHNKTLQKSGFSTPFDLRKIISNLNYSVGGNKILSGQLLKTFISEYLTFVYNKELKDISEESLIAFYQSRFQMNNEQLKNVTKHIKNYWISIENSIRVVQILKNRLQEAIIGIIETSGITATDSQMIFTLINQEGTKLSAVEILSAKPSWNIIVKQPSKNVEAERVKLYEAIKNEAINDTVRWDYPATFFSRLEYFKFLFPQLEYSVSNQLDKKLTLGFKILSGIYQKGIRKEDVDQLSMNRDIVWESDIDDVVVELNHMGQILSNSKYFKFLQGLGKSFMEITSDAVALNFLFTCYYDFKRKGKPIGNSTQNKIFIHNAICLADKLMFEYITFKWRGSSDNKISKNIEAFSSIPDKMDPINDQNWIDLFTSINENYKIDDSEITFSISKSLIYHIYSVMSFMCVSSDEIDIDHIIPQAAFNASAIPKASLIKNTLYNLCPLPSKDNIRKKDKKLIEISDDWLIGQIEHFTEIKKKDFHKFSDVQNWQILYKQRKEFFNLKFLKARAAIINN